jgi:riboflavin synthase
MFTGIIEEVGEVTSIQKEAGNIHFTIASALSAGFKIDQSVAHNGCCLTVVAQNEKEHVVTAIQETLLKTNLGTWQVGSKINIERCMQLGGRLDGHMVQGHVDCVGACTEVLDENGSWRYTFEHPDSYVTVEKGSITVNGTSLTVVDSQKGRFSVCIIPYTYEHTNFKQIEAGTQVNLEFDIIGKYVARYIGLQQA